MKLIKFILAFGLMTGLSQAVSISVSAGTPAQGFLVANNGAVVSTFNYSVGTWNTETQTFSVFGTAVVDTAAGTNELGGVQVTATGPASFANQQIALFVGLGADIASSNGAWVVLTSTNAATAFPADLSVATNISFVASTTGVVNIVGTGNAANGFTAAPSGSNATLNLVPVPEPSAALLGLLGVIGLIRRRRN